MPTGDRPNFPLVAQRLDKVDLEAVSDLLELTAMRLWANVMGPGWGLLSDVAFTWSAPNLTVGACRLGYCTDGGGNVADGAIVRHDPAVVPGTGVVNLTTLGASPGWIFFKRQEVAMDQENRAYWDKIAKLKKVGLANTRIREYVEFVCYPTIDGGTYTIANGYYPCFYVSGWVVGVPAVQRIHYLEGAQYTGQANGLLFWHPDTVPGNIANVSKEEYAFDGGTPRSMAQFTRILMAKLCQYMDSTWVINANGAVTTPGTLGWFATPTRGMKQINDYIDATVEARIKLALNGNARILFHRSVQADSSPTYIDTIGLVNGGDYASDPTILGGAAGAALSDQSTGQTRITFNHPILSANTHVFVTCLAPDGKAIPEVESSTVLDIHQYNADGTAAAYKNFSVLIVGFEHSVLPVIP